MIWLVWLLIGLTPYLLLAVFGLSFQRLDRRDDLKRWGLCLCECRLCRLGLSWHSDVR